jgi:hypothetical protein
MAVLVGSILYLDKPSLQDQRSGTVSMTIATELQ